MCTRSRARVHNYIDVRTSALRTCTGLDGSVLVDPVLRLHPRGCSGGFLLAVSQANTLYGVEVRTDCNRARKTHCLTNSM